CPTVSPPQSLVKWDFSGATKDRRRGYAEDLLLLAISEVHRLDGAHRLFDRPEQVRIVAPHGHVIGADDVAEHPQIVRAERDRVVVELLQIKGRRLIDADAAFSKVAPA